MRIKLVTNLGRDNPSDLACYWNSLSKALPAAGIDVDRVSHQDWQDGKGGADPALDIVVILAHEVGLVQAEYGVIALQHGCNMERGLRCGNGRHIELGALEVAAAGRKRTLWVAASDWSAYHAHRHGGARADRIIYGAVDVDRFLPSERQRLRDSKRPVVLHGAGGVIADVCRELATEFSVRKLDVPAGEEADALREADIWLSLSAGDALPAAVQRAMSTGMVVVGTSVGLLWSLCDGRSLPCTKDYANLWLNADAGVAVFDWKWRDRAAHVAEFVRRAWAERKALQPREYARQWFGYPLFAAKWRDAIQAAATRFGIKA